MVTYKSCHELIVIWCRFRDLIITTILDDSNLFNFANMSCKEKSSKGLKSSDDIIICFIFQTDLLKTEWFNKMNFCTEKVQSRENNKYGEFHLKCTFRDARYLQSRPACTLLYMFCFYHMRLALFLLLQANFSLLNVKL